MWKIAGIMVNLTGAEGFSEKEIFENIEFILGWNASKPHI
jgi:5-(carboxyamino)imidazole ribonucleotide synthase